MTKIETRDHHLTVRLPKYLYEALKREALADRRSIADVVVFALETRYPKRTKGNK